MTMTGTGKVAGTEGINGNGVEKLDKPLTERTRAVDAAILAIEKQFGRGSIMFLPRQAVVRRSEEDARGIRLIAAIGAVEHQVTVAVGHNGGKVETTVVNFTWLANRHHRVAIGHPGASGIAGGRSVDLGTLNLGRGYAPQVHLPRAIVRGQDARGDRPGVAQFET